MLAVGQRRANDRCRKDAAGFNDFTNDGCRKFPRRMPQETPQRPTMVAARFNEACRRNAAAVNDRANEMRRRRSANRNEAVKVHGSEKERHAVRLSELTVLAGQKSAVTRTKFGHGSDREWTRVGQRLIIAPDVRRLVRPFVAAFSVTGFSFWHLGVGSLGSRERVGKLSRSPCCRASLAESGCLCALAPRGAPRLPAP